MSGCHRSGRVAFPVADHTTSLAQPAALLATNHRKREAYAPPPSLTVFLVRSYVPGSVSCTAGDRSPLRYCGPAACTAPGRPCRPIKRPPSWLPARTATNLCLLSAPSTMAARCRPRLSAAAAVWPLERCPSSRASAATTPCGVRAGVAGGTSPPTAVVVRARDRDGPYGYVLYLQEMGGQCFWGASHPFPWGVVHEARGVALPRWTDGVV